MSTISRRQALGVATAGVGAPLLAACGGDDGGSSGAGAEAAPSSSAPESPSSPSATATATKTKAPAGGIPTSDVPVGGGLVVPDDQVVITQPIEGEFVAFSSICTHMGCPVARVTTEIECDCHGSRFAIESGEPVGGPATEPLPPAEITVSGEMITVG